MDWQTLHSVDGSISMLNWMGRGVLIEDGEQDGDIAWTFSKSGRSAITKSTLLKINWTRFELITKRVLRLGKRNISLKLPSKTRQMWWYMDWNNNPRPEKHLHRYTQTPSKYTTKESLSSIVLENNTPTTLLFPLLIRCLSTDRSGSEGNAWSFRKCLQHTPIMFCRTF